MSGLSVETYQLSKQGNTGGGSGGVSQAVLDRLDLLEANQMNIYNTFTYDFQNSKYIDSYKTTTIVTPDGMIPRQYLNNLYFGLDNDDIVDYDNSNGIKVATGQIMLDNTSTLNGVFTSFPIDLNKAIGAKFDFNFSNKITISSTEKTPIKSTNLWFVSETDKFGRLWVISSEQFSTGAVNKAHVVIYNTDMTVYKSFDLANTILFGQADATAAYPVFGAQNMKFTEENVAVIVTRTSAGIRNGGSVEYADGNIYIDKVVLLNELGQYNILGTWSGYLNSTKSALYVYSGSTQSDLTINGDIIYVQFGGYTAIMNNDANELNNRYRNFVSFRITGSLAVALSNIELVKYILKGTFPRTLGNEPGGYRYSVFRNSNVVFDGKKFYECFGQSKDLLYDNNYINQIYSLQCGVNPTDKTFYSEASNIDMNFTVLNAVTNKVVLYNHPGFNGMFYASNGKLYFFANDTTSKIATLNCYLPDWTSRPSGKLTVNNTISKTLNLQTCSYSMPLPSGVCPLGSYPNAPTYNQFMKTVEFDNKLHVFYIAPLSDTVRRLCLKYMSFDYSLNQIVQETILYQQESDTIRINDFDITVFTDDILVLCSIGDPNNFTVANATSKIYSVRIGKVSSSITFQYLDNVDKVWKNVSNAEQVTFNTPRDNIIIRAQLTSQTYNASPVLENFNIETWDNNGEGSRQSDYYSTQIESVQNDGKGVLTADYELNGGAIIWHMSFNGGVDYVPVNLNEEFVYNQMQVPDFRIKATMSVTDNATALPIIHSYTLRTSHVVLHSDLEEVQINLIKTNFKIDTFTNANKNGLLKMTIDTLSNNSNIDAANSDYTYYSGFGYASGNYIQTLPESIAGGIKTLLLTTEEVLDSASVNSKILYYVSVDGGVTFKPIIPNIKLQISNTNSKIDNLVMKAVMYDNAHLTAWGWAWD